MMLNTRVQEREALRFKETIVATITKSRVPVDVSIVALCESLALVLANRNESNEEVDDLIGHLVNHIKREYREYRNKSSLRATYR
jgi:hypothetical protein